MLNIVDVGKRFGSMNVSSISYDNLTVKDKVYLLEQYGTNILDLHDIDLTGPVKREIFDRHRMEMAHDFGFDDKKMFVANQDKKDGSYFELTKDFVEATSDGWDFDITEDILIITDKVPGVVAGHPIADCPVVMVCDAKKGVTALAHCSAELIDKKMPMMVVDALQRAYDSKDDDLVAYISACAGDGWTYNNYPRWATDRKLWDGAIREENGVFRIDMRKVLTRELNEAGVSMSSFSNVDTRTNPNYYSNSMASANGGNDSSKAGRNFSGAFYR